MNAWTSFSTRSDDVFLRATTASACPDDASNPIRPVGYRRPIESRVILSLLTVRNWNGRLHNFLPDIHDEVWRNWKFWLTYVSHWTLTPDIHLGYFSPGQSFPVFYGAEGQWKCTTWKCRTWIWRNTWHFTVRNIHALHFSQPLSRCWRNK